MSKDYSLIVVSKVLAPVTYKPRTVTIKTAAFIGSKNASLIEKIKSEITARIKHRLEEVNGIKIEVKSTVEITPVDTFTLEYYE